jgi:GntR family transcriptional regulator
MNFAPSRTGRRMPARRKWEVLAEQLAGEIEAGRYKPGDQLPTVETLQTEYNLSNITVRTAVTELRQRGLIRTEQGSGMFVLGDERLRLDMTRIESIDHRTVHRDFDAWSSDVRRAGRTPSQEFDLGLKACPEDLAELFSVAVGSTVTIRRCNRYVDGIPSMIETSFFPKWLVDELPRLGEPVDIPEGTTLYLAEHGYPIDHRVDELSGRPQTRDENTFLEVSYTEWMMERFSPAYAADKRVLRLMVSVYPASKYKLIFHVGGGYSVELVKAAEEESG